MRVPALLLFISAMTAQQATSRAPTSDALLSERVSSPGDLALARLTGHPAVEQREADEPGDPSLCFFSREKDVGRQLSCKHRLDLRSKFNYNPFGLRFGKRGGRAEPPRWRRARLLPALLSVRQMEEAS
ncbi:hypothetical protein NFI96_027957 [Prochilodus magdalenae]|nr:hypothetical protein NFI96_027957 [Prochilodus magdalenae]